MLEHTTHITAARETRPLNRTSRNTGKQCETTLLTKMLTTAPVYDFFRPRSVGQRDEAAHRARLKRLGPGFLPPLLPDVERLVLAETEILLRILEDRRGKTCDMFRLSHEFSLDVSGTDISFSTLRTLPTASTFNSFPLISSQNTISLLVAYINLLSWCYRQHENSTTVRFLLCLSCAVMFRSPYSVAGGLYAADLKKTIKVGSLPASQWAP